MVYRAIGLISSHSLEELDIVFAEFDVIGQKWTYELKCTARYPYGKEWIDQLKTASTLSAADYLQLHADFGQLLGQQVKRFMDENKLDYQVQLIGTHGHPSFHSPATKMTHRLGDGGAIAAITGVNVVSNLQTMDIALGGNGASLFSLAEKRLSATEPVEFKEALAVAFFALLRWREENNMLMADTGAVRDSIGGAVWLGQEW
jgi:anhydro-N-acetylmuramic acid kinase